MVFSPGPAGEWAPRWAKANTPSWSRKLQPLHTIVDPTGQAAAAEPGEAAPASRRRAGQTAAIDDLPGARASHPSKLTARFAALVTEGAPPGRLDEVCTVLAAHFQMGEGADGTDLGEVSARLDALADGVREKSARPDLTNIVQHMIACGFVGRPQDYQTQESSLLPAVLRRRRGLPILLAVVGAEVGRRLDVPVRLVGMPGHVLLGSFVPSDADRGPAGLPLALADPFNARPSVDLDGTRELFTRVHGSPRGWSPALIRPMPQGAVVTRILTNLGHRFRTEHRGRSEALALSLRCRVAGTGPAERYEMAQALGRGGAFDQAAAELEALAEQRLPSDLEPERLMGLARHFRARLN